MNRISLPEMLFLGTCVICYAVERFEYRTTHFLWNDSGHTGHPICSSCYEILMTFVPQQINYDY
ncbi:MAG: hypothetical protein ACTSV5_01430 [Promethearchaeota archaeon]